MLNPSTQSWISFEELKKMMRKEHGIEIIETEKDETFTIYNTKPIP